MNKQEILNEINKTKEHLANMEKMLELCEYERWKPKESDEYWYVSANLLADRTTFESDDWISEEYYDTYNIFKTIDEARQEAEKILVRRMLEDIARRLNEGEKIDWKNSKQDKYCLSYDYRHKEISQDYMTYIKLQGAVYCLDENFLNIAIQEIGKERLKKYLRGG